MGEDMLYNPNQQEMTQQLLDVIARDARELLHRVETAQHLLGSGKIRAAALYATMICASHRACGESLSRLDRISGQEGSKA